MQLPSLGCSKCTATALLAVAAGGYYLAREGSRAGWDWAKPDAESMGVIALSMGDAAAFFSAYNPSIMTAGAFRRKGGAEADNSKRDLYRGAFVGTSFAILVAAGGSMVTESWWPVAGTVLVVIIQWGVLWYTVENPWGETGSIASQPPGSGSPGKGYS
jgi:hypothetical protein